MTKIAQFGRVGPPPGVYRFSAGGLTGLPIFLSVILKTLIMGAGIYTLINFVLAGYAFLSAEGDPKKIQDAWAKIWQSIVGLLLAAGAFIIAGVIGYLIFGDPHAILEIKIFGP